MEAVQEPLVAVEATDKEWRLVAACIAACAARSAEYVDGADERELAGLWLRIHPEGDV